MPALSTRIPVICWIVLASATAGTANAEKPQAPQLWKAYYVNFGFPHEGSFGMTSATGAAQLTIAARSIKGTLQFDGFDPDAPPDRLSLIRRDRTRVSGTISNDYPEPRPPSHVVGRYQRLNGWPAAAYPSPFAGTTCFVDEIILEVQRTSTRTFYYFAKPCHPD